MIDFFGIFHTLGALFSSSSQNYEEGQGMTQRPSSPSQGGNNTNIRININNNQQKYKKRKRQEQERVAELDRQTQQASPSRQR